MERVRSRGQFQRQGTCQHWQLYNGCTPTVWTNFASGDGPYVGVTELMHDTVVPGFRERVAAGEVFFNPLYKLTTTLTSSGGNGIHIKSKTPSCAAPLAYHEYRKDGDFFGLNFLNSPTGPVFATSLNENDIESARVEVSAACQNARGRGDSNLWETFAEAHKASKLLQNLGGRSIKAATEVRSASNEYLAYQYGLLPIIQDVENVVKNLHKQIGRVRKTVRKSLSLNGEAFTNGYVDQNYVRNHFVTQVRDTVELRAMALDEYVASFGSNIGFTSKGLVTLPWELVRYSFVADWFLNVGDFLGALSPAFGYNALGSCLVETRTIENHWVSNGTTEQSGTYSVVRPWSGRCSAVQVAKHRYGLRPPSIVVRSDFRFDNFKRAADAFALTAQILLK